MKPRSCHNVWSYQRERSFPGANQGCWLHNSPWRSSPVTPASPLRNKGEMANWELGGRASNKRVPEKRRPSMSPTTRLETPSPMLCRWSSASGPIKLRGNMSPPLAATAEVSTTRSTVCPAAARNTASGYAAAVWSASTRAATSRFSRRCGISMPRSASDPEEDVSAPRDEIFWMLLALARFPPNRLAYAPGAYVNPPLFVRVSMM
mmetsp:Transcript_34443/g.97134  ORF Transcript_34443/g.97134 Transcript_34443/m.97134 type:complete len:206 (-) Transcript_34443:2076-2693(-)